MIYAPQSATPRPRYFHNRRVFADGGTQVFHPAFMTELVAALEELSTTSADPLRLHQNIYIGTLTKKLSPSRGLHQSNRLSILRILSFQARGFFLQVGAIPSGGE